MKLRIYLVTLLILMVGIWMVFGLKTTQIEMGYGEVYDSAVLMWRDAEGNLMFKDGQLTTPTTLLELSKGLDEHGKLTGLGADDHPQYLNAERHNLTHISSYNNALSVGPDVNGNVILGSHLMDADIHINREENEEIYGQWNFNERISLANGLHLKAGEGESSQELSFERSGEDALFKWDESAAAFSFNQKLSAPSGEFTAADITSMTVTAILDGKDGIGNPSGIIQNFQQIEGIARENLLDKSADEDISGSWDFLDKVAVQKSAESYSPSLFLFQGSLDTWINAEETVSDLTRIGGNFSSSFANQGTDQVESSANIGLKGYAESTGSTSWGEAINNLGVVGVAGSESAQSNVIGVAGISETLETNRARIGVMGGLDTSVLLNPDGLPQGLWAGYFAGDVKVAGTVYGDNPGNLDFEGYGDFKEGIKQDGTTRLDSGGNASFADITFDGTIKDTDTSEHYFFLVHGDNDTGWQVTGGKSIRWVLDGGVKWQVGNAGGGVVEHNCPTNLGNGSDLTTVKDALRLYPVSSWSGTDEGTLYYDSDADRVLCYSTIDGPQWEYMAYLKDLGVCPYLSVFTPDYPTTKVLAYYDGVLEGFIGKDNEGIDEVDLPSDDVCRWAFVVREGLRETAYFKDVKLVVDDVEYSPSRVIGGRLENGYRVLDKGDWCLVEFPEVEGSEYKLRLTGYYEPWPNAKGLHKFARRISDRISENTKARVEGYDYLRLKPNPEVPETAPGGTMVVDASDGKLKIYDAWGSIQGWKTIMDLSD